MPKLRTPEISLLDLHNKSLQAVYNEEIDELKVEIENLQNGPTAQGHITKNFRYTIIMCFWLAIHLEKCTMAQFIYDQDEWVNKLCNMIVNSYNKLSNNDRIVHNKYSRIKRKSTVDLKRMNLHDENMDEAYDLSDLTNQAKHNFLQITNLLKFKHALKTKAGEALCTNALKIALLDQEEKIACVLLIEYRIKMEEGMITRAIATQKFQFLYYMWRFKQNCVKKHDGTKEVFDYDYLFKKIITIWEDKAKDRIDEVAGWKIKNSKDCILRSLLKNNMDYVAWKYVYFYIFEAKEDLFRFAIRNENEFFIKHCLSETIFVSMLSHPEIINELLTTIEKGSRIELCFNIMIYTDFSRWRINEVKRLLDFWESILMESDESNKILLTKNTVMALAHCCEFLSKIKSAIKLFKRTAESLIERMQALTIKIVEKIDDELIPSVFLDLDFKNRTLFQITTKYKLTYFLSSNKVLSLLDSIWEGIEANEWDGSLYDFSLITYLFISDATRIPGKKIKVKEMLTNNFEPQIKNKKFWFQYKYRQKSVAYSFIKDLIWALGIVVIFQYINFKYLSLFRSTNFDDMTTSQKLAKAEDNISTYNSFNFIGSIFAGAMLYSVVWKVLFNLLSDVKLPLDKWTVLDAITSIICIVCFNVTGSITAQDIFDSSKKNTLDYYVAVVVVVSWIRFFAYFLVIRSISKLLMTLIKMMYDTLGFVFIMVWYLLLAASVYTTLFQGADNESYGSMSLSLRTLFDTMLGNYEK